MSQSRVIAKKLLPMPLLARMVFLRQYLIFGEWELRQLSRLASDPGLTIDVGANIGLYSYALKRMGREVVSFEPDPEYKQRLLALLGEQAMIESVALSDRPGNAVMRVPHVHEGYGGARGSLSSRAVPNDSVSTSYRVELRTLDSYNFEDVGFIKIDVEGHEESVLAGARTTLERSKPVLLIEIEDRHNPGGIDRIAETLSYLGYSGSFFFEKKLFSLSEFVPDLHQRLENAEPSGGNRRQLSYVNNFLFSAR